MHIFFSGIGGTAIGPLAMIAKQAGYEVSGSDKQESGYIDYLISRGISDIHIGQGYDNIAGVNERNPIDWYVYTSALTLENANPPELVYCTEQGIRTSKRDELLNQIISDKNLKLVAVAGTHGKTTTTAMLVWLFKQLNVKISYSLPAKTSFGEMGEFNPQSQYFIYEADEFDRNFLHFNPFLSLISGVAYDHQEIFPTPADYDQAFRDFLAQGSSSVIWQADASHLQLSASSSSIVLDPSDAAIKKIKLAGAANRQDAWLAIQAVRQITQEPLKKIIKLINNFPGLQRRMEPIRKNLYTDYAHTPEKVRGGLSTALELATKKKQRVIVIFEPLTDRRQHYMIDEYKDCFTGAARVYWLPSYLAREDPSQRVIPPTELISHLADPSIAQPAEINDDLKRTINAHLKRGDLVVGMAGGGGASLDEWLRKQFQA